MSIGKADFEWVEKKGPFFAVCGPKYTKYMNTKFGILLGE